MNKPMLRAAAAALALALASGAAFADTTMHVSIDTSTFGTSGWLDLQYNPANPGSTPATTVTLTGFQGFDAAAHVETSGQVSGSLAAGYVLGNGDSLNDLFHGVTYGGVLSFNVTFSGTNVDMSGNAFGSTFAVYAISADQATVLGNSSAADGRLLDIAWAPATAAGGAGSFAVASYADAASVSAVPEPSSWAMLGIGAMLVAGAVRRRQGGPSRLMLAACD